MCVSNRLVTNRQSSKDTHSRNLCRYCIKSNHNRKKVTDHKALWEEITVFKSLSCRLKEEIGRTLQHVVYLYLLLSLKMETENSDVMSLTSSIHVKHQGKNVHAISSKDLVHCYCLYLGSSTDCDSMDLKKLIADRVWDFLQHGEDGWKHITTVFSLEVRKLECLLCLWFDEANRFSLWEFEFR